MKIQITENDLLINFEEIKNEINQYLNDDPALKEYEKEVGEEKEKKPFFVVPASFVYTISSC